jgi:hypothetical protein
MCPNVKRFYHSHVATFTRAFTLTLERVKTMSKYNQGLNFETKNQATRRQPYVHDYYGRQLQNEIDKTLRQRELVGENLPPQYWKVTRPNEE